MKFFTQLAVTILGGLLLAFATPYLAKVANPDRLVAEIYPGAWYPYPVGKGPHGEEFAKKFTVPTYGEGLINDDDLRFARIVVVNPGRKTVQNIKLKFSDTFDASGIIKDSVGERVIDVGSEVRLADMAPGDRQIIYLWSSYNIGSEFSLYDVDSSSSEGSVFVNYFKYSNDVFRVGDGFPWLGFVSAICGALLLLYVVISIIFSEIYAKYVRGLLEDESLYIDERIRYVSDPKKFLIKPLSK